MEKIKETLLIFLKDKLKRFDIKENELGGKFDLVNSGLLNSLEFVDLVASLEKHFQLEIDYEKALEKSDFTTVDGLIRTFQSGLNG